MFPMIFSISVIVVIFFLEGIIPYYKKREDSEHIDFGLNMFMERKWQGIKGLLMIPFEGHDSK